MVKREKTNASTLLKLLQAAADNSLYSVSAKKEKTGLSYSLVTDVYKTMAIEGLVTYELRDRVRVVNLTTKGLAVLTQLETVFAQTNILN